MNTFESEFAELAAWIRGKNQEDDEAQRKDNTPGRDGILVYERRQVVLEYNRRLMALKKKYGRDTAAQEQGVQSSFARASVK